MRGLQQASLLLGPQINVWTGENGAGKTSVLEAVSLLSLGRSFVTSQVKSLIHHAGLDLTVFARVVQHGLEHRLALQLLRSGEKRLRVDGASVRGQASLSRVLPLLQMGPQLIDLVSGTPGDRRRWLDWGAFHVVGGTAESFSTLRRALLQRNTGLRSGTLSDEQLDAWDAVIDRLGHEIDQWRTRFVKDVEQVLGGVLSALGLVYQVELQYQRGWGDGRLVDCLKDSRARDLQLRQTRMGPHRADVQFRADGFLASEVLSRGQLKALHFGLMLAQLEAARAVGVSPVLSLDDPGAELDQGYQHRLWTALVESRCQVLVSGIDLARVGLPTEASGVTRVFHVKHGTIELVKEA